MGTATLLPLDEYLATSFPDGDREYLDGMLLEKNRGEVGHSDLQSTLLFYLRLHYSGYWAGVEVRVQVKARHFRVPDLCLVTGPKPEGRIITTPPFLVLEVPSPDDRMSEMQERIDDYLEFGVEFVWVVDAATRRAFVYTSRGIREVKDGVMRPQDPVIEIPLNELFGK